MSALVATLVVGALAQATGVAPPPPDAAPDAGADATGADAPASDAAAPSVPAATAPGSAAPDLRARAQAADEARDWPAALAGWQACAEHAPDRDARYCRRRAEGLAPHAADGFAGWDVLEGVRRDYRALGSDAALARVESAVASLPRSPAAADMKVWLLNERRRRGDTDAADALAAEIAAGADTRPEAARYVADLTASDRLAARRRAVGLTGAAMGGVYAAVALLRSGPLRWRSAAVAGLLLGAVPAVFAALYEDNVADGFVRSALVVTTAVLFAARAPVWLSVPGTVGGLAAVAWANDWYPSMGL